MHELWTFIASFPWKEIGLILGSLLGGGGGVKLYEIYFKNKRETEEIKAKFRDELREEISILRGRIEDLEKENAEWRNKFFDQQEQYHEIKRENADLRHAVEHLEEKIHTLKTHG